MSNAETVTITTTDPVKLSQAVSHPITSATITTEQHPNGQIQKVAVVTTKPGYTTTEFWVTVITTLTSLVVAIHPQWITVTSNPNLIQALALVAASVATGIYSISRAKAKTN